MPGPLTFMVALKIIKTNRKYCRAQLTCQRSLAESWWLETRADLQCRASAVPEPAFLGNHMRRLAKRTGVRASTGGKQSLLIPNLRTPWAQPSVTFLPTLGGGGGARSPWEQRGKARSGVSVCCCLSQSVWLGQMAFLASGSPSVKGEVFICKRALGSSKGRRSTIIHIFGPLLGSACHTFLGLPNFSGSLSGGECESKLSSFTPHTLPKASWSTPVFWLLGLLIEGWGFGVSYSNIRCHVVIVSVACLLFLPTGPYPYEYLPEQTRPQRLNTPLAVLCFQKPYQHRPHKPH